MTAETTLELRAATLEDMKFVWEVNNDSSVREQSIQQEPIPWESHQRWYENKLRSEDATIWIVTIRGTNAGVVRFERSGGEAEISIALSPAHRGKGLGSTAIRKATEALLRESAVDCLLALVRPTNIGSARAFEKAGYERHRANVVRNGVTLEQFTLERSD